MSAFTFKIIGLTASLGVDGSTDRNKGENHMKMIMANLDADYLCTVRTEKSLEELRKYVNIPTEGRSSFRKTT